MNGVADTDHERQRQKQQQLQQHLPRKREAEKAIDESGLQSDSSSDQVTVIERQYHESRSQMDPSGLLTGGLMMPRSRSFYQVDPHMDHPALHDDPTLGGRIMPVRRKKAKSKSPARRHARNPYQTQITPAISPNIDVFGILENVAKTEGAFSAPEDALRASIAAFTQDAW